VTSVVPFVTSNQVCTRTLFKPERHGFPDGYSFTRLIEEGCSFWALDPATCADVLVWLQHDEGFLVLAQTRATAARTASDASSHRRARFGSLETPIQ